MSVFGSRRLGLNYFSKVKWKYSLQVKNVGAPLGRNVAAPLLENVVSPCKK
jgi:hypothetical protein